METLQIILFSFLAFIVVISVIVFIHEFGHYFVAKINGVKIESFSIGFGPEITGWNDRSGTRWKLSYVPLGGYVKMFGDEGAASTPDKEKMKELTPEEEKMAFHSQNLWVKSAVVSAGPIANFLLAIVIYTIMFSVYGRLVSTPEIGDVVMDSAAYEAGLQAGDYVLEIDGEKVERFSDIQNIIQVNPGKEVPIVYRRDNRIIKGFITPKLVKRKDRRGNEVEISVLGVASVKGFVDTLPLGEALVEGAKETYSFSIRTLQILGQIITGERSARQISGIIRIGDYTGQFAERSIDDETFYHILRFMAILSINLGLINLFPIPMLDGGHLLYYAVEAVSGRPLAERVQEYGFRLGFVLLIALMVFALFNDLRHYNVF